MADLELTWERARDHSEWVAYYLVSLTEKRRYRDMVDGLRVVKRGRRYKIVRQRGSKAEDIGGYVWVDARTLYDTARRTALNELIQEAEDWRVRIYEEEHGKMASGDLKAAGELMKLAKSLVAGEQREAARPSASRLSYAEEVFVDGADWGMLALESLYDEGLTVAFEKPGLRKPALERKAKGILERDYDVLEDEGLVVIRL